jgi:hypothetical protein
VSLLVLSDDELALLRFTCELYFSEESPLYFLDENTASPRDADATYKKLIERNILDPSSFQLTDDALNRIAPVAECDGMLTHTIVDGAETQKTAYWLLDDIAVSYERIDDGRHVFGPDLDPEQFVDRLCRVLQPRRSGGARLSLSLSAAELVVLSKAWRVAVAGKRMSWAMLQDGLTDAEKRTVESAVGSLVHKDALVHDQGAYALGPGVRELGGVSKLPRHTLVRRDFTDDKRHKPLLREVTFFQADGSVFVLGPATGRPGLLLEELDGESLRTACLLACGPLRKPRSDGSPELTSVRMASVLGLSRSVSHPSQAK